MQTIDGPSGNGFADTYLLNEPLPELNIDEIDLSMSWLGKTIAYPLIINAITGGTEQAGQINRCLAMMADKFKIPMAVGSGVIALDHPEMSHSFKIAREMNPDGLMVANIGAHESVEKALAVVQMIDADALQLHFNVPQELAMEEGERHFKNILANVKAIVEACSVPIIAKEVGFGLSRETTVKLFDCDIRIFDNSGQGGTNFIAIEQQRGGTLGPEFYSWGIPTAWSLAEIAALQLPVTIIASGGIRNAVEAVKAMVMGAELVGIAAPFLKAYMHDGEKGVENYLQHFLYGLKAAALMIGAQNRDTFSRKPLIIMGQTAEWLRTRGVDPLRWADPYRV